MKSEGKVFVVSFSILFLFIATLEGLYVATSYIDMINKENKLKYNCEVIKNG